MCSYIFTWFGTLNVFIMGKFSHREVTTTVLVFLPGLVLLHLVGAVEL